MAYRVFLSHSMGEADRDLVAQIAGVIQSHGIDCYIASRDYQIGHPLPDKIATNLRTADSLVALLTEGGAHREWVDQEIGFARGIQRLIIPVVEVGVEPGGFLAGLQVLGTYLAGLRQRKENTEQLIVAAAVVAALIIIIVLSSEGGGTLAVSS